MDLTWGVRPVAVCQAKHLRPMFVMWQMGNVVSVCGGNSRFSVGWGQCSKRGAVFESCELCYCWYPISALSSLKLGCWGDGGCPIVRDIQAVPGSEHPGLAVGVPTARQGSWKGHLVQLKWIYETLCTHTALCFYMPLLSPAILGLSQANSFQLCMWLYNFPGTCNCSVFAGQQCGSS